MKELGYGEDYKYAHSYENNFVKQTYLPDEIKNKRIWHPQNNSAEKRHSDLLNKLWGDKYSK